MQRKTKRYLVLIVFNQLLSKNAKLFLSHNSLSQPPTKTDCRTIYKDLLYYLPKAILGNLF